MSSIESVRCSTLARNGNIVGRPAKLSAPQLPRAQLTLTWEWSSPEKWPNSWMKAASNSGAVSSRLSAVSTPSWKMPFMTAMPLTICPAPLMAQGPAKPMTAASWPRSTNNEPFTS